ncbi:MAG: excinuclease ABC subunit B, partial [Gammaproteobacteria bacterium]
HGITPKGIIKAIRGSLDDKQEEARDDRQYIAKIAEEKARYAVMTPKQLAKRLQQMEQAMYRHAQNLEFEEAGKLRDEMEHIRAISLGPEAG